MGLTVGSWYKSSDIEMDGCGRTGYEVENLDGQNGKFLLEDGFAVRRVLIA